MGHTTRPSRSAARLGAGLLVALALALVLPASALATTVLKMDLEALVGTADAIVVGQVVAQEAVVEEGKVFTVTTIRVDELLKGESVVRRRADGSGSLDEVEKAPETLTIKQIGGRTDSLATYVAGMPSFEVGEEVVLFAERPKQLEHFVVTGLSQGKFHIALGPDSATKVVVPRLGDVSLVERTQALSPPVSDEQVGTLRPVDPSVLHRGVVPLDAFTGQIRQLVDAPTAQPSK